MYVVEVLMFWHIYATLLCLYADLACWLCGLHLQCVQLHWDWLLGCNTGKKCSMVAVDVCWDRVFWVSTNILRRWSWNGGAAQ